MANPGIVKAVIALHKKGFSIVAIAKSLNLHIHEVAEIINDYQ